MIQLRLKKKQSYRLKRRLKSKAVIRKKISGKNERPRLVVFRSHKHIYAQVIDDQEQKTLAQASTLKESLSGSGCGQAKEIGRAIAQKVKEKGIQTVVFDRNGYVYHGRVQALAEGARKEGLLF